MKTDPATIRVDDYPQLRTVAWNLSVDAEIDEREALALYERNWRFVDVDAMTEKETAFVQHLIETHGGGLLHV